MRMTPLQLLLLAILVSGLGPVLVRESPVGPAATAFWRLAIPLPIALWYGRDVWHMGGRDTALALLGGLLLAADLVLWNTAVIKTSVMEATVLVMLFPLLVAAAEIGFFGRKLRWNLLAGGGVAFLGTGVIAWGAARGHSSLAGDLMAVTAAVFYAASLLISGRLCQRRDTRGVTFWVMLGAALGALPISLLEASPIPRSAYDLGYLAFYGAITFTGYSLYNVALSRLPTTLVAISGYGQPVIATGLAYLLLSEVPTLLNLFGAAIVVAGLLIATVRTATPPAPEP
jgi:drug/metabolite transporter (DMT)-like permease